MRLDQFLVQANICSRSEAKKYVKAGRVAVAGEVVRDSSQHIDEYHDRVTFDNEIVNYSKYHYYMLNKPMGCVSATVDGLSDTVIDILKDEAVKDLFPVGRLDKDTEGLLLITDDGKLAHNLLSPKKHVSKVYFATVDGRLSDENKSLMENGIDIGDDKLTLPARVEELSGESHNGEMLYNYRLSICEGRFHQVKRMFAACGLNVLYLKRLSMGSLQLDDKLKAGQYRALTQAEVDRLSGG